MSNSIILLLAFMNEKIITYKKEQDISINITKILISFTIFLLLIQHKKDHMNKKIKNQQYEVIVSFKTDNCLTVTAEFLPTGEHFRNDAVELMRINKDTVIAALERKSEKHLRCEFQQLVQDGKKSLQIAFIVNFDFLPQFRQEISLEQIELKDSLNAINLTSMNVQIDQMCKALQQIEEKGSTFVKQTLSCGINNSKKQVENIEVKEGRYILRISGFMTNSPGTTHSDIVKLYVEIPGEAAIKQITFRCHNMNSYYLPFSTAQTINASKEGTLRVSMTTSLTSCTISNMYFVLNRVAEFN